MLCEMSIFISMQKLDDFRQYPSSNMAENRHTRLISGKTFDQNFISGKFSCIKSCPEILQRENE